MSSGDYCVIRDLGLVKGGKGLRHHEVVLKLSWKGALQFAKSVLQKDVAGPAKVEENLNPRLNEKSRPLFVPREQREPVKSTA